MVQIPLITLPKSCKMRRLYSGTGMLFSSVLSSTSLIFFGRVSSYVRVKKVVASPKFHSHIEKPLLEQKLILDDLHRMLRMIKSFPLHHNS